jgi:hypothetical protein
MFRIASRGLLHGWHGHPCTWTIAASTTFCPPVLAVAESGEPVKPPSGKPDPRPAPARVQEPGPPKSEYLLWTYFPHGRDLAGRRNCLPPSIWARARHFHCEASRLVTLAVGDGSCRARAGQSTPSPGSCERKGPVRPGATRVLGKLFRHEVRCRSAQESCGSLAPTRGVGRLDGDECP